MSQLLPRTPRPIVDESYAGYCLRLQEENGLNTLSKLLNFRTMKEKLKYQQPSPQILKNLTNHSCDWLAGRDGIEQIVNGHPVINPLIGDCSICVDCIHESGYLHSIFDLKVFTACTKHKKQLLYACPSCHKLNYHRRELLVCNCGFNLDKSKTNDADPRELELLEVVSAVIHNTELNNEHSSFQMPLKSLSGMSLSTLLVVIESIGRAQCVMLDQLNRKPTPPQITQAAAHVFSNWPKNYHQFLEDYAIHKSERFNHKFSDWNLAHSTLFDVPYPANESQFMLAEYYRWVETGKFGQQKPWVSTDYRRLVIQESAAIAGYAMVTGDTLEGVSAKLNNGEVFFLKPSMTSKTTKFHKYIHHLHRIQHEEASYVAEQACVHLGINLGLFMAIKKSGYLLLNYKSDKPSTFAVPDLDHFKTSFLMMQSKNEMPHDGVRLSSAFKKMRGYGQYNTEVILEILRGGIAIYGDEDQMLEVFISESEVRDLLIKFSRRELEIKQFCGDQVRCVDRAYLDQLKVRGLIQLPTSNYRELFQTQ